MTADDVHDGELHEVGIVDRRVCCCCSRLDGLVVDILHDPERQVVVGEADGG